jgi:hypothetical protein
MVYESVLLKTLRSIAGGCKGFNRRLGRVLGRGLAENDLLQGLPSRLAWARDRRERTIRRLGWLSPQDEYQV